MSAIINQYLPDGHQRGAIRIIAQNLLENQGLDEEQKALFTVIKAIFELDLLEGSSHAEYINDFKVSGGVLDLIAHHLPQTENLYIQAYFQDVLQVNKRDKYNNCKAALESYWRLAATYTEIAEKREFFLRIINILKGLGKGNKQLLPFYFDAISAALMAGDMQTNTYTITKLAKELVVFNQEAEKYAAFAEKIDTSIEHLLNEKKFREYRKCNLALAVLRPERALEYRVNAARSYVMDADHYDATTNALQYTVASLYQKALRFLQDLQIKNEETENIRKRLVAIRVKAAAQHRLIGNLPPVALKQREFKMPDFDNFIQGIYWLISFDLPPRQKYIDDLERNKGTFLHMQFLESHVNDADGNTTGISPDGSKTIYRDAAYMRSHVCKTILWPAYDKFSEKFSISELEAFWMISSSAFIPKERMDIYAHGLYQGFCGNFAVAVHLLVPQIENGLRYVLNTNGITTRKVAEDIQTENGLTTNFSILSGVLHEDLLFDLEGLLNEPFGENIRNLLAHGLVDTGTLFGPPGFYTWWIALKLALTLESYKSAHKL